jgi:tRNA A37 threonylcarbamoyladenosine dehydratase
MDSFTGKEFERFALLIGKDKLELLTHKSVAILGLGGVGSFACEALARSGVGGFVLVDFDTISETNFNRQVIALRENLGKPKVEVMAERIKSINPGAKIFTIFNFIDEKSLNALLHHNIDFCLEAIDSFTLKIKAIKALLKYKIPFISSMGAGGRINPLATKSGVLSEVTTCALAARLKKALKKDGVDLGAVQVVYSLEPAVKPQPRSEWESGELARGRLRGKQGSACFVPAVFGMAMAYLAVKNLMEEMA